MKEKIKEKFKALYLKLKINKLVEKLKLLAHKLKIDKLIEKMKKVDKNIYIKTLILIFIPILIYLFCQLFCNGKLFFEPKRMLLNFMFIYFIIGFIYCIVGKLKISLIITIILTGLLGIINHFITAFRGTPLVPWDIFSLNVALTVLPTFQFTVTREAVI